MAGEYTFEWKGSGMGRVWFRAVTPEYGVTECEYVTEQHLTPYFRDGYNGTPEEFEREVAAVLNVLCWKDSGKPVTKAQLDAFNAWRQAKHEALIARMRAEPDRYGTEFESSELFAPPPVLRGGQYVPEHGWVITAEP